MAPTNDGASWDATTVSATAVMVAMARAAETGSASPLIQDQFAQALVAAPELAEVRAQVSSWWADSDTSEGGQDRQLLIDYMAVRTHFFDAYFTAAAAAGIGQHVILAAGLDTRAYRLNWPDNSVIYEVDLPGVLAYKAAKLEALGDAPASTRREVGVDLREDWPAALRASGFDSAQPTAWLAEGLLPYLSAAAQETLFSTIAQLSAPGSQVAIEVVIKAADLPDQQPSAGDQRWQKLRETSGQDGDDGPLTRPACGTSDERPASPAEWFASHGWTTQSLDSREESKRRGRYTPEPRRSTPDVHVFRDRGVAETALIVSG